jgi:glycosyltransferase involved in cell wall biosynthesis
VPPGILPIPADTNSARDGSPPVIGCIARLSPEKGIDILLQALAHLYQTTEHRPQCMIAGDGPLLTVLKEQATRLQINDSVVFPGWQDDITAFIEQVDFLVLPSRSEGFGLAVLEGWRQGRPTIGSQTGGIAELIQDGQNGLLVPPNNFQALSAAMVRLLENRSLIQWMGQRGRQEKLPAYTMEAMVQQTEQIYQKCIVANEESARNRS